MRATPALILTATFAISLAACESVVIVPADEDISAEAFRLLSAADIHEIERLATAVAPKKPLKSIHAASRDEVSVTCGDPYRRDAEMTSFTARRKNGRWLADRSSIGPYRPIIVD